MLSSSSILDYSQQDGEISIQAEDGHISTLNGDDEDPVQPYVGEPIADEEWISQYERRNAEELRLQILRSRFNR